MAENLADWEQDEDFEVLEQSGNDEVAGLQRTMEEFIEDVKAQNPSKNEEFMQALKDLQIQLVQSANESSWQIPQTLTASNKQITQTSGFFQESLKDLVNVRDNENNTPIFWAIKLGYHEFCKWLIDNSADVNARNDQSCSPVYWAVRYRQLEMLKLLTQHGAKVWLEAAAEEDQKAQRTYREAGLGTPLALAAAMGEVDIVTHLISVFDKKDRTDDKILLDIDQFINFQAAKGYTALHYAAKYGKEQVVKILSEKSKKSLSVENDLGQTPLLVAVESKQIAVVKYLLEQQIDINDRDKSGRNVWDYRMKSQTECIDASDSDEQRDGNSDTNEVNENSGGEIDPMIQHFVKHTNKKIEKLQENGNSSPEALRLAIEKFNARSPLHVAAEYGDVDSLKYFIDHISLYVTAEEYEPDENKSIKQDPWIVRDEGHGTFLFSAVGKDQVNVLEYYYAHCKSKRAEAAINSSTGDTIFHEAVRLAKRNCLEYLADRKPGLLHQHLNKQKESLLHVACGSKKAKEEVVATVTEVMSQKEQNLKDKDGNTALHIVMMLGREDFVKHLCCVNPLSINNNGDTPMHVAARHGQTATMIALFEIFKTSLNVHAKNKDKQTVLHLAALHGDKAQLELLINHGADLLARNTEGDTVLHLLVNMTLKDPNNTLMYIDKFMCVTNKSVTWWCKKHEKQEPHAESDAYKSRKREAALELITETLNNDGLSVLAYAARYGARDIFEEIIQLNNVFHLVENKEHKFDITYFTPNTTPLTEKSPKKKISDNKVGPDTANAASVRKDTAERDQDIARSISCIEHILDIQDVHLASEMLDVVPMLQLVKRYWGLYQYMYIILALIHVLYMSFLSVYALPLAEEFALNESSNREAPKVFPYILLLVWPGMLFVYEVVHYVKRIKKFWERRRLNKSSNLKFGYVFVEALFLSILKQTTHFASLVFSVLVIFWFGLYTTEHKWQLYVLAVVLILGWMYTISLLTFFEGFFSFSIILKNIIIQDIRKFVILYVIVMVGFSLALRVLLYPVPAIAQDYPSLGHMFFYTFNLMIGLEDHFFNDSYDDTYTESGYTGVFTRFVYITFVMLSTIILLNVLIAMMTDSYSEVKRKEGKSWKVQTMKKAIYVETMFTPITKRLHEWRNEFLIRKKEERWELTVDNDDLQVLSSIEARGGTTGIVARLDHRVKMMDEDIVAIRDMVSTLMQRHSEADKKRKEGKKKPRPTAYEKEVQIAQKTLIKGLKKDTIEDPLLGTF